MIITCDEDNGTGLIEYDLPNHCETLQEISKDGLHSTWMQMEKWTTEMMVQHNYSNTNAQQDAY